jgi:hypothetical protein
MMPRHVIGSASSDHFLAVSKKVAVLCRAEEKSPLRSFPLSDDTDSRVSFSTEADACVVGSWSKGLTAYRISTGKVLWRNRRVTHFSALEVHPSGVVLLSGLDPGGCAVLNLSCGEVLKRCENASKVFLSPSGSFWVYLTIDRKLELECKERSQTWTFEWPAFTVLSVAFGGQLLIASTPDGALATYRLDRPELVKLESFGTELSSFRPVAYDEQNGGVLALGFDYHREAKCALFALDAQLGCPRVLKVFRAVFGAAFLARNSLMVTTSGELYSTADGTLLNKIDWSE